MFRGRFAMNDPCPVCGLIFQREEGYFLGAMYVSYVLGCFILVPLFLAIQELLPGRPFVALFVTVLLYLPLVPVVFRWSRVGWIYFERAGCWSDASAGTYEKMRIRERDRTKIP